LIASPTLYPLCHPCV